MNAATVPALARTLAGRDAGARTRARSAAWSSAAWSLGAWRSTTRRLVGARPGFALSILGLGFAIGVGATAAARADELVILDGESCGKRTVLVHEFTSETWAEVKYRQRARGPETSVPARQVLAVVRTAPAREAEALRTAFAELERGNLREALVAFQNIAGGGFKQDAGSGQRSFVPFGGGETTGAKRTRAPWQSEYSHIGYVKALAGLARQAKDARLWEEVLLSLENRPLEPLPDSKEKRTTGGFLARFEGGNSRYFPDALHLHAEALLATGDFAKARTAYQTLLAAADQVPLDPVWAFEGMLGEGLVLAAEGKQDDAERAFDRVAATMLVRLEGEADRCRQLTLGRLYSEARLRVAEGRLAAAEKVGGAAYGALRRYVEQGAPEVLAGRYRGKMDESRLAALLAGARHPRIQAVGLNAQGLALLEEKNPEAAAAAFKEVAVKYFGDRDQTARALYWLGQAARKAAEQADKAKKPAVRDFWKRMGEEAVRNLKARFKGSTWAQK